MLNYIRAFARLSDWASALAAESGERDTRLWHSQRDGHEKKHHAVGAEHENATKQVSHPLHQTPHSPPGKRADNGRAPKREDETRGNTRESNAFVESRAQQVELDPARDSGRCGETR